MNLLIALDARHALVASVALELDPGRWRTCGYGYALAGSRFDKIVVMGPRKRLLSATEVRAIDEWLADCELKLPEGRKVNYI